MNESSNDILKAAGRFLIRFFLGNFFWIIPVAWCCAGHKVANIVFYSALVTYGYFSARHYFREKAVSIRKTPVWVVRLYFASVVLFLLITLWSTYQGMKSTYSLTGTGSKVLAFSISAAICLTLLGITQMVKSRRTPEVLLSLVLLYFVLDGLTALPANFLFFYENARNASTVVFNKQHLGEALDQSRKYVERKRDSAQRIISALESRSRSQHMQDSIDQAQAGQRADMAQRDLENSFRSGQVNYADYSQQLAEINYGRRTQRFRGAFRRRAVNQRDTVLEKALADREHCVQWDGNLQAADGIYNRLKRVSIFDDSEDLSDSLRIQLHDIIQGSTDPLLRVYSDSLRSNKPTAMESVKMLYRFIFAKMGIMAEESDTITAGYDKDTTMLILISLSSSIVIDILPLFFSLLYAKYRAND